MPDLDDDLRDDDMMNALFADVRHEVAGFIRPAGAAAAAATVKRRRRNRTIAAGALAVALVVGPAIGLAWASNGPDRTPEIATTPTVTDSASASAQPSLAPSAPSSSGLADPGIPADQLRNMTLTVPQWSGEVSRSECPAGSLKFTDGRSPRKSGGSFQTTLVGDPVHVDVDADGRNETVIRVDCQVQGLFSQVVAFSRDRDGKVSTRGRVVATHLDGSDVEKIWKIEAGPASVRVDVGDHSPCCGIPEDLPQHQWRTYGWDGQKFHQTGGPSKFPPNPRTVDLVTTVQPYDPTSVDGTTWLAPLSAAVRNNGPKAAPDLRVTVTFSVEVTLAGADAARCENPGVRADRFVCRFGRLGSGSTRQLRFDVTSYADPRGKSTNLKAEHGDDYPDPNPDNNIAQAMS